MKLSRIFKITAFIVICEMVGVAGSYFTLQAIPSWYAGLNKPFFNPPNWLFGPVWTILYALMGYSAFLVWEKGSKNVNVADSLRIFGFQLFINAIWTPVFFGLKDLLLALIVIICLDLLVFVTIRKFYTLDRTAGSLLVPYFLWISFATLLNFSLMVLNL